MAFQFGNDLLRKLARLFMEGAIAKYQIVVHHQIFDMLHRERHAHGDADGADGEQFDGAFDPE